MIIALNSNFHKNLAQDNFSHLTVCINEICQAGKTNGFEILGLENSQFELIILVSPLRICILSFWLIYHVVLNLTRFGLTHATRSQA